jgi:hypothetical protein
VNGKIQKITFTKGFQAWVVLVVIIAAADGIASSI